MPNCLQPCSSELRRIWSPSWFSDTLSPGHGLCGCPRDDGDPAAQKPRVALTGGGGGRHFIHRQGPATTRSPWTGHGSSGLGRRPHAASGLCAPRSRGSRWSLGALGGAGRRTPAGNCFWAVGTRCGAGFGSNVLTTRRQRAFADQLDSSLQLMASSLRAGHSLLQALASVAREADQPTSEEFARTINRDAGRARPRAGHSRSRLRRMDSDDFAWVTQAIAINREVGGNLAEVLDGVSRGPFASGTRSGDR